MAEQRITWKDLSSYEENLDTDDKNHYIRKLTLENGHKLPDPFSFTTGWSDDPTTLPDISFADIYMYVIHTPSEFTHEKLRAHKSLDAYQFFVCGHVHDIGLKKVKDQDFYFLRSSTLPSQRQGQKEHSYQVWIALHEKGWILTANCTCMAG